LLAPRKRGSRLLNRLLRELEAWPHRSTAPISPPSFLVWSPQLVLRFYVQPGRAWQCPGLWRAKSPQFISKIFRGQLPQPAESLTGDQLLQLVAAGGYPDAVKRRSERRRQDWYRAYLNSIVERDVPEIADIAAPERIPRLLEISARFSGQLTNLSELGRAIGLDHKTVEHYLRIREQIYLVQRLQPWSRNELSPLVKTPKLQFIDSGLLTALRGYSIARLRSDLGPILERALSSRNCPRRLRGRKNASPSSTIVTKTNSKSTSFSRT
jgi:hypothetical protein